MIDMLDSILLKDICFRDVDSIVKTGALLDSFRRCFGECVYDGFFHPHPNPPLRKEEKIFSPLEKGGLRGI
jgi:hypothetical protein